MAVQLTVNNNTFEYPTTGESPGWGAGTTDWAIAVTEVLNTLVAPGDILQTSFVINNNVSISTDINRMIFDAGTVRAANITYSVNRVSDDEPTGKIETGTIYLTYDAAASAGNKWILGQQKIGDAEISFSVTDSGQVQYRTTDIGSVNYTGTIKFSARTLSV